VLLNTCKQTVRFLALQRVFQQSSGEIDAFRGHPHHTKRHKTLRMHRTYLNVCEMRHARS
jgi:hypothetical protein